MKTLVLKLLLFILSFGTLQAVEPRDWTNKEGDVLNATLLEVDGDEVRLQLTSNRRVYKVPISSLSEADQKFIDEARIQMAEEAAAQALADRDTDWTEDWEAAKKASETFGLPIMLLMTGSDWCPPCMALEDRVFESREFEEFAAKNLILMKADFPNGSQKRSTQKQNAELKQQYPFSGYPTVHVLDMELGVAESFTGYGGEDPGAYIKKLAAVLKSTSESE